MADVPLLKLDAAATDGQVPTADGLGGYAWETPAGATSFRGARAYLDTTAQSLAHAAIAAINFNGESFDTDTLHDISINSSRVLLNAVGYWRVHGQATFAGNSTGERMLRLHLNGSLRASSRIRAGGATNIVLQVSDLIHAAAATDYVELAGYQDSTVSLNVEAGQTATFLSAEYLGG